MRVRGWRNVALLVLAPAALAGCGGGSSSSATPLVDENSITSGGLPSISSTPTGLSLRFIEGGRLGFAIVLRNSSRHAVTVVDARTVDPPHSLVHQIGTRLVRWNPRPCRPRVFACPMETFFRGVYERTRPTPVTVAPRKAVGVQLNFRLGSCAEVPFATSAATQLLQVTFRYGQGNLRTETIPLGGAALRLGKPAPIVCQSRPHSRIALSGLFPSSTEETIPGSRTATCTRTASGALVCSDGDRCTQMPGGGLLFRSGLFGAGNNPMIRVAIRLPRFRGVGLYRGQVLVKAAISGRSTFRARTSVVTVTRATTNTVGGRFHATLLGYHRAPFRAYGTWACTRSRSASGA
jgi:hypothetical protein